jgi:two-component system LytT family response regulator
MASILVCEDDKSTLVMFCKLLEVNPLIDEIYRAGTGNEAVRIIKEKSPDILILDIDLPDTDGIQVAKIACDLNPKVSVAFVTGYPDFAAQSFVVHPYDYIIKPIDVERFLDTVNKLATKLECDILKNKLKLTGKFPLKTEDGIMFLNLDDVIFIEKNGKETIIHTKSGMHKCNCNLKDLESNLNEEFYRVHKSFIVNVTMIERIKNIGESYVITFHDNDKIALMSKSRFQFLKEKLV